MSSESAPLPPLPSPGLRRKGPKNLPSLPLSAFSGPNTGTSDMFPLPPTPSAVFPGSIIDAHLAVGGDLNLQPEGGQDRLHGAVLTLTNTEEISTVIAGLETRAESDPQVLSVLLPFKLDAVPSEIPYLPTSSKIPTTLATTFVTATPQAAESLNWALQHSRVVDVDVQADIMANDPLWETFEEVLTKATKDLPDDKKGVPIVLSNIFPPPHDLSLPIVKLMKHPTYRMYQSHTASLSLFPNLYVKLLPPSWDTPVPSASALESESSADQLREWKRRIKMYIGPVLEAFGYERIIFGTAPSPVSTSPSKASDWYEIVRESFAELGVDQEAIDAVFNANADKVYRNLL